MHLCGLVLFLLGLPGGARRSIRIDGSHHDAQQQRNALANDLEVSAEAREALFPGGFGTGIFRRAGLQAGALREGSQQDGRRAVHLEQDRAEPWFRSGLRRAEVAFQAASGPEAYQLPLKEAVRETASFATTAEASIVASFDPLLAERLAVCNPSRQWPPWSKQAVVVLDDVLGASAYERLRPQAEAIRAAGMLEECESSGAVRATQCAQGDDDMRAVAKDLVALPLAIARAVSLRMNDAVGPRGGPRLLIEDGTHTNKLAVVESDGAGYAKHVDNVMGAGLDDARKLTAIYYLNPHWNAQAGGHLRVWDADIVGAEADGPLSSDGAAHIAPRGDRLVVFWSDALVHDVEPSRIVSSADHRWALTVWFIAMEPWADPSLARGLNPLIACRHFDAPASSLVAPARRFVNRILENCYRRLAGTRGGWPQ